MRAFLNRLPKWVVFGSVGMTGGLLFSLMGEPAAALAAPVAQPPEDKSPIDLVFVLDVTGSMQKEIDGVRGSINEFIHESESARVGIRFALVTFRDLSCGEPTEVPQAFTADPLVFASSMSRLRADGGGDNRGESSLDGLRLASMLPFRPEARKVMVLITDETWHEPDGATLTANDLFVGLQARSIEALHVVASRRVIGDFDFLSKAAPGRRFVLDASGRTDGALGRLFQGVAREVVRPSMIGRAAAGSRMDYSFASYLRGVASVGLWLSLVSIGIGLFLVAAQRLMLGASLCPPGSLKAAALGTLLGAVAGVCAQSAYFGLSSLGCPDMAGRVFSWMLVGSGLGFAMTFVVPNINLPKTLACGAAGGALGAACFVAMVTTLDFSDLGGRLAGAMVLGFALGVAVAMAEMMAREAFLVVHWAKNEKSTVNIGPRPVEIGTTNESTVRLSAQTGYPPRVASFSLVGGKATLVNHISRTTHVLKDGNKLTLGTVVIEVRILH
jgi:Ca-activated chloride channel family protein